MTWTAFTAPKPSASGDGISPSMATFDCKHTRNNDFVSFLTYFCNAFASSYGNGLGADGYAGLAHASTSNTRVSYNGLNLPSMNASLFIDAFAAVSRNFAQM